MDVRKNWIDLFGINEHQSPMERQGESINNAKNRAKAKKRRLKCTNVPVTSVQSADCEVVVFQESQGSSHLSSTSRHKKRLTPSRESDLVDPVKFSKDSLDLDKLRHEVRQYGITGYKGEEKEEAQVNLIVKLGGKPPKKSYVNYKDLQEKRKAEKAEELQRELDFDAQLLCGFSKHKRSPNNRTPTISRKFASLNKSKKTKQKRIFKK